DRAQGAARQAARLRARAGGGQRPRPAPAAGAGLSRDRDLPHDLPAHARQAGTLRRSRAGVRHHQAALDRADAGHAAARHGDPRSTGAALRLPCAARARLRSGAVAAARLPRRARREHRVGHLGDHARDHRATVPRPAAGDLNVAPGAGWAGVGRRTPMLADPASMTPPARALVRNLFLRLLGVVFVIAFWSLGRQVLVLYGEHGLLPACPVAPHLPMTVFRLDSSDGLLWWGTVAGGALGCGVVLGLAPRWLLLAAWLLYGSYVRIGQDFLSFQWDNLLLESSFFALFVTPAGWRLRDAPAPHPLGVFLMPWLLFRLYVQSGLAQLLLAHPTWRDLTAMPPYYETAPLPTWIGWYVHQLPLWAHRAPGAAALAVGLVVPFLIWGPRRLRPIAFVLMVAFQLVVLATGNYGFFNYLSLALCLWVLDDGHLAWLARRLGRAP